MRSLAFLVLLTSACSVERAATAQAPSQGEAQAAGDAYRAYCGLCGDGEGCGCLKAADFVPERWSQRAGPYLRAMRGYYECQRLMTLTEDGMYPNTPTLASREGDGFAMISGYSRSCGPHACTDEAEAMAQHLPAALLASSPQPEKGALLAVCEIRQPRP